MRSPPGGDGETTKLYSYFGTGEASLNGERVIVFVVLICSVAMCCSFVLLLCVPLCSFVFLC